MASDAALDRESALTHVPTPDYLSADDYGDWNYYVSGHDPDELVVIDEPEMLLWEPTWMRPQPVSSVDPEERGDWESVTRDKRGRFAPAYCWIECSERHPDARPFLAVRYKPHD